MTRAASASTFTISSEFFTAAVFKRTKEATASSTSTGLAAAHSYIRWKASLALSASFIVATSDVLYFSISTAVFIKPLAILVTALTVNTAAIAEPTPSITLLTCAPKAVSCSSACFTAVVSIRITATNVPRLADPPNTTIASFRLMFSVLYFSNT